MEFRPFPKMGRMRRGCVITEKIDDSNASITITGQLNDVPDGNVIAQFDDPDVSYIRAGSRNRWITPEDDNYGFARWVKENAEQLRLLGPGTHFGEWWGSGIQRRYGLSGGDKRFSLFNAHRWGKEDQTIPEIPGLGVVPVLYDGDFSTNAVEGTLAALKMNGSCAAPGFMNPEGVIVFHVSTKTMMKVTIKDDGVPKGMAV